MSRSSDSTTEQEVQTNLTLDALANKFVSNGTIRTTINSSLSRELNFTLGNGNVDGAITVNSSSGDIVVYDSFAFDFERITQITSTVTVSNGSNNEE
ncbi:MAG: hypothetical protein ACI9SG_002602 [Maribacter sp.]|jgi:hypothetical protein